MPALRAGFLAGRYRLDHLLSRGGMGQVWAARHVVTNHPVAVKVLAHSPLLEPQARRRFLREARTAAAVSHPNVVKVHDFFELEDGTPAMVMELLDGETLARKLDREKTLSLAQAAEILLPVVAAVGHAHSLGIVHRDLKPDNVFLVRRAGPDAGFEPCVLDFGIAKLMTAGIDEVHGTGVLTGTGTMLGTPSYMSPEQTLCESVIDHRADIWAIGVILYEALAGVRPFDWTNVGQLVRHFMTHQIKAIEELRPDVPGDVADLIGRMLSRPREARPADLREVYAVLARFTDVRADDFGPPLQAPYTATLQSQIEETAEPTLETAMDVALTDESEPLPVLHRTPRSGSAGPQSISIRPERGTKGRRLAMSAAIAGVTVAGFVYILSQWYGASARAERPASSPPDVVTTRAVTPATPVVERSPEPAPEPSASAAPSTPAKKSTHAARRAATAAPGGPPSTATTARDGLIDEIPF